MLKTLFPLALSLLFSLSAHSLQAAQKRGKPASTDTQQLRWLEQINSRADFDKLSRTYYRGRFYALPHLMFVVDRRAKDKVYFINSKLYVFHKDFVNAEYLSLERGKLFYENNYLKPDRRFLLGTIAYQPSLEKFTFEFWEADKQTKELLAECYQALSHHFYAPIFFKPNSLAQEEVAKIANDGAAPQIPVVTTSELASNQQYQPLNPGTGIGQLRIIDKLTPE